MAPRKITLKAQLNRAKAETQQRQQEDRFVANKYKSANKERIGEDDEDDEVEDDKEHFTGPSPQHQTQGALDSLFVGFGGHQDSFGATNDSDDQGESSLSTTTQGQPAVVLPQSTHQVAKKVRRHGPFLADDSDDDADDSSPLIHLPRINKPSEDGDEAKVVSYPSTYDKLRTMYPSGEVFVAPAVDVYKTGPPWRVYLQDPDSANEEGARVVNIDGKGDIILDKDGKMIFTYHPGDLKALIDPSIYKRRYFLEDTRDHLYLDTGLLDQDGYKICIPYRLPLKTKYEMRKQPKNKDPFAPGIRKRVH